MALAKQNSRSIITLTNQDFNSFANDYSQARAAYLSTLGVTPPDTSAKTAFESYTKSRVNLLAQQIISASLTTSAAYAKNGSDYVLPSLIARKVNGVKDPGADSTFALGTLGQALTSSIPDPASSAQASTLNSLAQDQSIEAARIGVVNGLNVIKSGQFSNKNKHR